MKKTVILKTEKDMLKYAEDVGFLLSLDMFAEREWALVIELVGDVGVGKTTFVRGFAKGVGIKEEVTSPSYTISKSYPLDFGRLVHYDFYRLEDPGIMKADLMEVIREPESIVFIEWGETVEGILPHNRTIIRFEMNEDGSREITTDEEC